MHSNALTTILSLSLLLRLTIALPQPQETPLPNALGLSGAVFLDSQPPPPTHDTNTNPNPNTASLSADQPISFTDNIARGISLTRTSYPSAQLIYINVAPRPGLPTTDVASLKEDLKLRFIEGGQGSASKNVILIAGTNGVGHWGAWGPPAPDPHWKTNPDPTNLTPFEWGPPHPLKIGIEEAVTKLRAAGVTTGWSTVNVVKYLGREEPFWMFWGEVKEGSKRLPLVDSVGGISGRVRRLNALGVEAGQGGGVVESLEDEWGEVVPVGVE